LKKRKRKWKNQQTVNIDRIKCGVIFLVAPASKPGQLMLERNLSLKYGKSFS